MTIDTAFTQERRLVYWNRFLGESPPLVGEIDRELLSFAREGNDEERQAFLLLRSCAQLAEEGSSATRKNLQAAVLYWFSQAGSEDPDAETSGAGRRKVTNLYEVLGCRWTWQQSAEAVGRNPKDYSAYRRIIDRLRAVYERMWSEQFGRALQRREGHGSDAIAV